MLLAARGVFALLRLPIHQRLPLGTSSEALDVAPPRHRASSNGAERHPQAPRQPRYEQLRPALLESLLACVLLPLSRALLCLAETGSRRYGARRKAGSVPSGDADHHDPVHLFPYPGWRIVSTWRENSAGTAKAALPRRVPP